MRGHIKSALERMLIASGIAATRRRRTHSRTLILAYHNVVPEGETARGDLSLHLPERRFASQLDTLARFGDVVPLTAIHEAPAGTRPRFAITFDDAYLGALTSGVEQLRRRSMPATVFVAPALLGETTWWDLLADPATGAIPVAMRDHALAQLAGRGTDVVRWARDERIPVADARELPRIATVAQLHAAMSYDALDTASHSWSHPNLSALHGEELNHELRAPADWLSEHCPGRHVPWLSYPYGLSATAVERGARAAGYTGAVLVEGGWHGPTQPNAFAVPRYNVPSGLSDRGFVLRLSGIGA